MDSFLIKLLYNEYLKGECIKKRGFSLEKFSRYGIGYLLADALPLNKRIWSPTFVLGQTTKVKQLADLLSQEISMGKYKSDCTLPSINKLSLSLIHI